MPTDDDDDVSTVLEQFRPQPAFLNFNQTDLFRQAKLIGGDGRRKQQKQKRQRQQGFSQVLYAASDDQDHQPLLKLSYLYQRSWLGPESAHLLLFTVSCTAPFRVSFVGVDDNENQLLLLTPPMEQLSADLTAAAAREKFSLFALVSKLLRALNDLDLNLVVKGKDGAVTSTAIHGDAEGTTSRANNTTTTHPTAPGEHQSSSVLDLATLLLRCAAASSKRATLCSPRPTCLLIDLYDHQQQNVSQNGGDNDFDEQVAITLANQIFSLPDFTNIDQPQQQLPEKNESVTSPSNNRNNRIQSNTQQHRNQAAKSWKVFLRSLPWVNQGMILSSKAALDDVVPISQLSPTSSSPTPQSSNTNNLKTFQITLDLESSVGDPSPRYSRLAQEYGVTQAFHGTHIERVWSILNYGLQNLSHNSQLSEKNGTMLGEGIYCSTAYNVAALFAQQTTLGKQGLNKFYKGNNNAVVQQAWRHPALLRLIQRHCSQQVQSQVLPKLKALSSQQQGDNNMTAISCFPVLEMQIISPSASATSDNNNMPRRQGNYYVVPNPHHIRLVKLHLTFEISSQRKSSSTNHKTNYWMLLQLVSILVGLVAVSWMARTKSNPHAFQQW